jgi:hypothetical protein
LRLEPSSWRPLSSRLPDNLIIKCLTLTIKYFLLQNAIEKAALFARGAATTKRLELPAKNAAYE